MTVERVWKGLRFGADLGAKFPGKNSKQRHAALA